MIITWECVSCWGNSRELYRIKGNSYVFILHLLLNHHWHFFVCFFGRHLSSRRHGFPLLGVSYIRSQGPNSQNFSFVSVFRHWSTGFSNDMSIIWQLKIADIIVVVAGPQRNQCSCAGTTGKWQQLTQLHRLRHELLFPRDLNLLSSALPGHCETAPTKSKTKSGF